MHPNHVARPIVRAALERKTITYSELGVALGRDPEKMPGRGWGPSLKALELWCGKNNLPPLTVCVVAKDTGRPASEGTYKGRAYGEMSDEEIATLQSAVFSHRWLENHAKVFALDDLIAPQSTSKKSARKPSIVAHCDWSKDPKKRWMSVAVRSEGRWSIGLPEEVGPTSDLLPRLRNRSKNSGGLFIGFDFPIGLPCDYGSKTGLASFRTALQTFGSPQWSEWFSVCDDQEEISIQRPFYPMRPGGRKKEHLLRGLGLDRGEELLRRCELKTSERQAACSLFWTLGGNQVGKGAISGWQEVLKPNLDQIGLWPFDGPLSSLFETHASVIAETYPGDVYGQIGIPRRPAWSKRAQAGRASVAGSILNWIAHRNCDVPGALTSLIGDGFDPGVIGEDQFDATIGLLGMLDVVDGLRSDGCPDDPLIKKWEGWILGQGSRAVTEI